MKKNTSTDVTPTVLLGKINEINIWIIKSDEDLVPINNLCRVLSLDLDDQIDIIASDDILYQFFTRIGAENCKNKEKMDLYCIPLKWAIGWIFTVEPDIVLDESKRADFITLKKKCYDLLVRYSEIGNLNCIEKRN